MSIGIIAVLLPWMGVPYIWTQQTMFIAILSLTVSGLNLTFGFAGELALGQVAMYAAGAYVGGYLALHGVNDLLLCVLSGAGAAMVVGLMSGVPGLRLGGWAFAMVSFFLVLLIPDVVQALQGVTGGYTGLFGIPAPKVFGVTLGNDAFYVVVLTITIGWVVVMRNMVMSRYGNALRVLRESPVLASSVGLSVYRTKLLVYLIGSIPAGVAGVCFAYAGGFVSPDSFGLDTSLAFFAASILGGKRSVYGAIFGSVLLELGPLRSNSFAAYGPIVYGVFLLLGGVILTGGVAGLAAKPAARLETAIKRKFRSAASDQIFHASRERSPVLAAFEPTVAIDGRNLDVRKICKRFGGIDALTEVSLQARPGQITALIGGNGSGKTTLLNLISGFYSADQGEITIGDVDVTGATPHAIARLGVARTFQTPIIPEGMTALDVVSTGRLALEQPSALASAFRLPRFRRAAALDQNAALQALHLVGLDDEAGALASSLALGTRRLIELARATAARPAVLLLDEVASGLDEDEIDRLGRVVTALATSGMTVLLVEHNFRFVRTIADQVVVLSQGRVIASGTATEIERDPTVVAEYLGIRDDPPTASPENGNGA